MRTIFRVLFLDEYIYFYIILTLLDAAVSLAVDFLYDFTVVPTCCSSYAKQTSSALMQQVIDRKFKKYVSEKGVDSDSFRCLATSDCGLLHSDTKDLMKALAHRAKLNYENVRHALQLEIEKMSAYTVVTQLREYAPTENWMGGLRL